MMALVQLGLTAKEIGDRMVPPITANTVLGKCTRLGVKVGRSRYIHRAKEQSITKPPIPEAPPSRPAPEACVDRGPLCSAPNCPYTKQPGRDWCHEHVPLPVRRRANMTVGGRFGFSSLGDFTE